MNTLAKPLQQESNVERSSLCDIVLNTWNRPAMAEIVIKTIKRNTKPKNYRLIVVDDGSDEQTQDTLQALHDSGFIDELVLNEQNKGLEPCRNQGLNLVRTPYVIFTDSDCLAQPMQNGWDWIENLVDLMEARENYAAISCRTQVMIGTGNIFDGHEHEDVVDFPHPGGSLRIMRTQAVRDVGGWRNDVPGRGAEERYICSQLQESGYKTAFAVKVRTLHLFGTRGDNGTDRWGYDKAMAPEESGHNDIWHPALEQGDDPIEVGVYAGKENTEEYFNA